MTDTRETHPILTKAGTIRVAPLLALPALLDEFQIPWQPLFAELGLARTILDNPENTLPIAAVGQVLQTCATICDCPHFGLLLGQRNGLSTLGAAGFLMRNAPDVKTALHELMLNYDLHDRGATPFIRLTPETATLGYEIHVDSIDGARHVSECAVAVGHNLMKGLCGPPWRPQEVLFRHGEYAPPEIYRRFFQAPVRFNADHNALVFRTACLDEKVAGADLLLRHHFQQHVANLRSHSSQDFKAQVRVAIAQLIAGGSCTQETLAAHFSLHPRTLNRRLKDVGTSFREMLGQARHTKICKLLRDTDHSIEAISAMLGYSSRTALDRAFVSWEGVPPSKWRADRKSASPLAGESNPALAE